MGFGAEKSDFLHLPFQCITIRYKSAMRRRRVVGGADLLEGPLSPATVSWSLLSAATCVPSDDRHDSAANTAHREPSEELLSSARRFASAPIRNQHHL